jgi:NADH-quinone oxidoreductase subunit M
MEIFTNHILTILIFLPLIGAITLLGFQRDNEGGVKLVASFFGFLNLLIGLYLFFAYSAKGDVFQFVERYNWIKSLGVHYYLGVDAVSMYLIVASTLITAICLVASWKITKYVREYFICILFVETGVIGALAALDLVLFYVFWEVMLIPMYFLIGIWGDYKRIYSTLKFYIYTMAGSVIMLVAIFTLYWLNSKSNFDILQMYNLNIPASKQMWLFLAFFVAFAIKVPLIPFHTWQPDTYVNAPTAGTVLLAAVLSKMGVYGFYRFAMPLFPDAAIKFTPVIATLTLIAVVYISLIAIVQKDMKRLIAYSSVGHLAVIVLGLYLLTTQGVQGAIFQMLNHTIVTGALFLLLGLLFERSNSRLIKDYSGIAKQMPLYATFFMIAMLASVGLPGTNGFIGEFLLFLGIFKANTFYAVIACSGTVFGAIYMLWMYQRSFFGPLEKEENKKLPDMNVREFGYLIPLIVLIFVMGLFPQYFIKKFNKTTINFINTVKSNHAVTMILDK